MRRALNKHTLAILMLLAITILPSVSSLHAFTHHHDSQSNKQSNEVQFTDCSSLCLICDFEFSFCSEGKTKDLTLILSFNFFDFCSLTQDCKSSVINYSSSRAPPVFIC